LQIPPTVPQLSLVYPEGPGIRPEGLDFLTTKAAPVAERLSAVLLLWVRLLTGYVEWTIP